MSDEPIESPIEITPIENQGIEDAINSALRSDVSPIVETPPVIVVRDRPQEKLTKKIVAIQTEFGGESNIPINHEYWVLLNQLRSLRSK